MATYEQNLRNIRGEAIYGPPMRESIAEAIQQAQGLEELKLFENRIRAAEERIVTQEVTLEAELISGDDYMMVIR